MPTVSSLFLVLARFDSQTGSMTDYIRWYCKLTVARNFPAFVPAHYFGMAAYPMLQLHEINNLDGQYFLVSLE